MATGTARHSKTVSKALGVLTEFMKGPPFLGVTDLSRRMGLPAAVVQRIVNALYRSGFLEREAVSRRYSLGLQVLELGAVAANYNRLMIAAQPVMQEVNQLTGEAVLLGVVDKQTWRGAYIHIIDAAHPGNVRPRLQQQGYLHASSTRKVLLASLPPDEIDRVLHEVGLPRLTPRTITDRAALYRELGQIQRQGYAISRGEAVVGTTGVAAPITDRIGHVVASLGISIPDARLSESRLLKLRRLVVRSAGRIATALNTIPSFAPDAPRVEAGLPRSRSLVRRNR
jgi:IclR family acetate operon transcriptional repressor